MKLPINEIGENFREVKKKVVQKLKTVGETLEKSEAVQWFKDIWEKYRVNDSNFKVLEIALNDGTQEVGQASLSSFSAGYVNKLFDKADKKKEEDPSQKFYLSLNVEKLSKLSKIELKGYLQRKLSQEGFPSEHFNTPINMKLLNKLETPIDLSEYQGVPLIDGAVNFIKSQEKKSSEVTKNDSEPEFQSEKNPENDDSESIEERVSNIGEGSGKINYFVGYKKDDVARLFAKKPDLLEKFECFVEMYNYLMNLYTLSKLDKQQAIDIHDDILPHYFELANACSSFGGEGSQIKNLCDGMIKILEDAYTSEINGVDLDPLKTKQTVEKMGISHEDDDGINKDSITLSDEPDKSQMFDDDGDMQSGLDAIQNVVLYKIEPPHCRTMPDIQATLRELAAMGIVAERSKTTP